MKLLVNESPFECVVSDWSNLPFPIPEGDYPFPVAGEGYVAAVEGSGPWTRVVLTLCLPVVRGTVRVPSALLRLLAKEDVRRLRFYVTKSVVTERFTLSVVSDEKFEVLLELSLENASFEDEGSTKTFWIAPGEKKDFPVRARPGIVDVKAKVVSVRRAQKEG